MTILSLHDVSKSYGALQIADAISFEVTQGEALGIIGPNGAGKSTLFNLITGNVMPDSGAVRFLGKDVTSDSAMSRCISGIGRSFQVPQPFEKLTVYENLSVAACFGNNLEEASVVETCAAVLEQTGLLKHANAVAGSLPLLQRKRLELARAMATAPKLLLLDEIAGGLTEAECQSLIETIRGLHSSGTTIIWIEHVLHALTSVVEKLLVLDFGKVVGIGHPKEIMSSREVKEIYLGIEV